MPLTASVYHVETARELCKKDPKVLGWNPSKADGRISIHFSRARSSPLRIHTGSAGQCICLQLFLLYYPQKSHRSTCFTHRTAVQFNSPILAWCRGLVCWKGQNNHIIFFIDWICAYGVKAGSRCTLPICAVWSASKSFKQHLSLVMASSMSVFMPCLWLQYLKTLSSMSINNEISDGSSWRFWFFLIPAWNLSVGTTCWGH